MILMQTVTYLQYFHSNQATSEMNNQFLSFSSGCVINFDDIGDFPDYHEIIATLRADIKHGKMDPKSIQSFVDAELEDIQHIPQCSQLFLQLTANPALFDHFTKSESKGLTLKQKFIVILLKVVKGYFITYSLEQEKVQPLIQYLNHNFTLLPCEYLVDFVFSLAEMAAYAERHQQLLPFILKMLSQEQILRQQKLTMMYFKAIDKILRFRLFREQFSNACKQSQSLQNQENQKKIGLFVDNLAFLRFKLAQYQQKHSSYHLLSKEFQVLTEKVHQIGQKCKENEFLQTYMDMWKVKIHPQ